jgi:diaminopropionate ammonia-lyase
VTGVRHFANPYRQAAHGETAFAAYFSPAAEQAKAEVRRDPAYRPSPLLRRTAAARRLGLGSLYLKNEGARLAEAGLASFKPLGVLAALAALGPAISHFHTFVCASDGNYGRAVAWAAARSGRTARVFVPEAVTAARSAAIAGFGAEVVPVAGGYDDAMRAAAEAAGQPGCLELSDTGYPGAEAVPLTVSYGYGLILEEVLAELPPAAAPTHVLVPVGVGGLAAGLAGALEAYRQAVWPDGGPRLVVVEPEGAACLQASLRAGAVRAAPAHSLMMGLACETPSTSAWPVLRARVDDALAIADDWALAAMRELAEGGGDAPVVAGETGAATYGALLAAAAAPEVWDALGFGPDSRVLLLLTEGATDPELYAGLVGRPAAQVAAGLQGV